MVHGEVVTVRVEEGARRRRSRSSVSGEVVYAEQVGVGG